MKATWLWSLWQGILLSFALGFSRQGEKRFVEWGTGLAVNIEEHTITQSLIGLGREGDWKALESFAEYGSWQLPFVQFRMARSIDRLPNRLWYGYRVWAGDDSKVHRNSPDVWGLALSTTTQLAAPTAPARSAPTTGSSLAACCPCQ